MKCNRMALLAWSILVCDGSLAASADWQQACQEAVARPLSSPAFNGPLPAATLTRCDSAALYYGFGSKPDYAAALQCAWHERAHPRAGTADMNHGVGVLAMLYANGFAVKQDIALARRFVCENEWAAPAETQGRLAHLDAIGKAASTSPPFDMCDDANSGLSGARCASIRQRFADAGRDRKLDAIAAGPVPDQSAALRQG